MQGSEEENKVEVVGEGREVERTEFVVQYYDDVAGEVKH